MALSNKHTVPSSPGFRHILSSPDYKFNKGNFLVFARQNNKNIARLGVSLRKRDYRLATHRNMIKRRLKNSFMKQASRLPSFDIVVLVKPGELVRDRDSLEVLWRDVEGLKGG